MYKILKAEKLAEKIFLMDVEAPRVAKHCEPGKFVIVKMDDLGERIPLTICDYDREAGTITIVVQIVGASTEKMSHLKAEMHLKILLDLLDVHQSLSARILKNSKDEYCIHCRRSWNSTCISTG